MGRHRSNKRRRRSKAPDLSEPRPDVDDEAWIECGGEPYWAVGTTSAGFPYGPTLEEMRETAETHEPDAPWVRAKRAFRTALAAHLRMDRVDIGWVDSVGSGLDRHVFRANAEDPSGRRQTFVALAARKDADPEYVARATREAAALRWLVDRAPGLRAPRLVALVPDASGPTVVETFIAGVPLELRHGRQGRIRPWDVVAEVASVVHTLPAPPDGVVTHRTAAQHRRGLLAQLAEHHDRETELVDARAWLGEHVETTRRGCLLHGDLLGQNIRLDPTDDQARPGLIDWEYVTMGDAAYDLSIVTRGAKRPFQLADGLPRLLDAYNARVSTPVTPTDVHFFELLLVIGFYRQDRAAGSSREHVQNRLRAVANVLRRANR